MKRLCVFLCALVCGAGCTAFGDKAKEDDFWKGSWPDDMVIKNSYGEVKKAQNGPEAAKPRP